MDEEYNPTLISRFGIIFDVVLTIIFYLIMAKVCSTFAPAMTEKGRLLGGAFCAIPMAGTFWMAVGFFRVTLVDQLQRKKHGKTP